MKNLWQLLNAEQRTAVLSKLAENAIDNKPGEVLAGIMTEGDVETIQALDTILNTTDSDFYGVIQDGVKVDWTGVIAEFGEAFKARCRADEPDAACITELSKVAQEYARQMINKGYDDVTAALTDLRVTLVELTTEANDGKIKTALTTLINVLPEPEADGDEEPETKPESGAGGGP